MERQVDISFSDQAKTIMQASDVSKQDMIDFLVEAGGFTVGGNEVIAFLESKSQD